MGENKLTLHEETLLKQWQIENKKEIAVCKYNERPGLSMSSIYQWGNSGWQVISSGLRAMSGHLYSSVRCPGNLGVINQFF